MPSFLTGKPTTSACLKAGRRSAATVSALPLIACIEHSHPLQFAGCPILSAFFAERLGLQPPCCARDCTDFTELVMWRKDHRIPPFAKPKPRRMGHPLCRCTGKGRATRRGGGRQQCFGSDSHSVIKALGVIVSCDSRIKMRGESVRKKRNPPQDEKRNER